MLLSPVFGLLLASFVPSVYSQEPIDQAKVTLQGTWSSGSRHVITGQDFANPINMTFNYPPTTGISYSFTDTFYEISRYRLNGNGSEPTCITGIIGWSHGKYQLNPNGSMTLFPFPDGFQQVQDPCAAVSENFIETYMITQEFYTNWLIFDDQTAGPKLHMFQFDGSPLPPMFKVSTTPIMLPTQVLRNVTNPNPDPSNTVQRRDVSGGVKNRWSDRTVMMGVSGLSVVALVSLIL